MNKVTFHYADASLPFHQKRKLKAFIEVLFKKEKVQLRHLTYIFCSDEYLLKVNRDFLKHDFYTDIITFNLSEDREVEGEIYISTERVKENALNLAVPFSSEILRVVFHGALHLCGFNDKRKSEITKMRMQEDLYMRLYNKKNDL